MTRPTPLLDFFKRGEVAYDLRLTAAQGALAPTAHEQLAILILLLDDTDPVIRETASATLDQIPNTALTAYLGRSDVPLGTREFFADRGLFPAEIPAIEADGPLIDPGPAEGDDAAGEGEAPREDITRQLARMGPVERMKAALKGSREMRAVLIRDPNKIISASVLSSPKLTEHEVESFARMANLSEDVLRIIGSNRMWTKKYGVVVGLARNPKTPLSVSLNLVSRLNKRDLAMLSIDRNIPEPLRSTARRRIATGAK